MTSLRWWTSTAMHSWRRFRKFSTAFRQIRMAVAVISSFILPLSFSVLCWKTFPSGATEKKSPLTETAWEHSPWFRIRNSSDVDCSPVLSGSDVFLIYFIFPDRVRKTLPTLTHMRWLSRCSHYPRSGSPDRRKNRCGNIVSLCPSPTPICITTSGIFTESDNEVASENPSGEYCWTDLL